MSTDFDFNKRVLDDVAVIPTKRIRNKIAGYAAILMRRIQKGPVRGISLKLQEAERERRMEFIPDKSEFKLEEIKVDNETRKMLEHYGYQKIVARSVEYY
jgi:small subunit ribosomal protein S17e